MNQRLPERLKDVEHLLRLALLFIIGTVAFLVVRSFLIPEGFGTYGHYRAGALVDSAAQPLGFAGETACFECHDDIFTEREGGMHQGVHCESCHGPLADHAAEKDGAEAPVLDAAVLCVECHRASATKPKTFPQIDPAEHEAGKQCTECHKVHNPEPEVQS